MKLRRLAKEKMLKLNFKRIIATVVSTAVVILILLNFAIGNNYIVFADSQSEGFVITDYHVDVRVTEDRIYKITENISCDFSEERHGIFREIPTSFYVERADGSRSRMNAVIKNIDANTNWEKDGGNIRLGDEDTTVIGKQDYTLSYDYVCDIDTLSGKDEFYFNIIGSEWETIIKHVTFNVNLPKDYDSDKVGFSMGESGIAGVPEGELIQNIDGLNINGETLSTLQPGEALTIRVELPDGYFVSNQSILDYWQYIIIAILAILSALMCFKWGRDDKIIPVVQFEAPEGYNSLDVGVMDHLDARDTDVLSLLVYLADKGYLTIEPIAKKYLGVFETQDFIFTKLKDYDGNNPCEAAFLDGLFTYGSKVTSKDLKKKFYTTVQEITFMERDFTKTLVWRKGRIPISMFLIASFLLMWMPSTQYGGFFDYIFSLSHMRLIAFLIGLACVIIMIASWGMIQRRTPLGVELAGKARGLAEFIETAEKDRVEQLVEDDPESFYKILPYASALGVSDKWIKKFEGIMLRRPSWYIYGDPYIDGYFMGSMLGTTLQDTMQEVSASPSSSGGGGLSGGGAGGGGGGSW